MADRSSIEWTEATWNPTTGCDRTSPGCDHCYALTLARRLKAMGNPRYQIDGGRLSGPGFGLTIHSDQLDVPRRWASPRVIFVNSMSDLFHPKVPVGFIRDVFAVMAETPRHTYQVLTKRSHRLTKIADTLPWLENVWVGVTVECDRYTFRVEHLRDVPAHVRFVSAEPLLGPITSLDLDGLAWVIAGGESGLGARPMHPDWVRGLRDRCQDADVAFFFKQWGAWRPERRSNTLVATDGSRLDRSSALLAVPGAPVPMQRMAKHAAGRRLDGQLWNQMPPLAGLTSH